MKSRNRRRLKFVVVLVALYAALGFFAVPPLLKWDLEKRLARELERPVSIERVRTNPFALSVTLSGVHVRVPDGSEPLVTWDRLHVNLDPLASFRGEWVLGDFALDGLRVVAEVREDGSLNFSDLIEKYRPPEDRLPSKPSRPWRVRRLNVTQARIEFLDRSQAMPFETAVGPMNFTVLDFRTAGVRGAPGRFEAVSESGEKLTWIGTLAASPLTSSGELRIENVLLPKYAPYLAGRLKGTLLEGRLGLSAAYEINLSPNARRISMRDGAVQLKNFRLAEQPEGAPVVEVGSLEIAGVMADLLTSQVTVDSVRWAGGRAEVRREADGSINLLNLVPTGAPAAAAAGEGKEEAAPWEVTVKEIAVRDVGIEVQDLTTSRPVEFNLARVSGSLLNASTRADTAMPVALTFDWAPRGTVGVTGNLMREPMLADLQVEAVTLELARLSPYLEQALAARIERGAASMRGQVRVTEGAGGEAEVTVSGEGRVEDLSVVEREGGAELAGFSEFGLYDVKLATAPRLMASVAEVRLDAPRAKVVRREDGVLNLAQLTGAGAEDGAPTDEPANEGGVAATRAAADLTVTRVLIANGEFSFDDRSMQPAVRFALTQVGGTLRNFSSQHPELGSIDLRATVNGTAPVTVIGRLNPLPAQPFADLLVDAKAIELAPAGAYVSKFAGYELQSGRLFLDTKAKLADEKLDLQNTVTLEQFALGAATPGPDAVKLPVKLGVALLKDAEGKIVLDLPVQGSLTDPAFDIGKVVGGVFTGLLTKAATSPFSLIGSMFGGGGEELAQQEFAAGEVTPTEESVRRLVTVQRALTARPALNLEIEPGYDPVADAEALKAGKLEEMLRRELARETRGDEPTERDRENVIRRVFEQRFPAGVSGRSRAAESDLARTVETPGVVAAPVREPRREVGRAEAEGEGEEVKEEEKERRGLLGRALDIATLKAPRNWWSDRRERKEREERAEEAQREEAERAFAAREEAIRRAQAAADATMAGEARVLTVEEMQAFLEETIEVTPGDLVELARARAERVREFLTSDGRVAAERVRIREIQAEAGAGSKGARAVLHLQ